MRIAEVNDIASVASELARGLRDRGHDVTIIQPRLFGGGLHWAVKPVVSPVRLLEWTRLVRRLRAERYDLIHIHYAYLGMVGVLGKFPYILHCHGSDIWQITPFTRYITSRALKNAGHVFYATPDLAGVLDQRPDAEFLPNPIDTETFRPLAPPGDSAAVYIACALDDLKGGPAILEACHALAAERPDIKVTAIAGGKYTSEFRALPNVTLLPRQARADLPAVISRHSVVVGQTNLGAAGMAEFESMSCARPVVCHFTFGHAYPEPPPFVAGKTGPEIAAAVMGLVDDAALRARLGDESRAWIERYHDLRRITERVEQAAFDLLQQPQAIPCPAES
jgi:glycosyltransferase involved in cell wall biosynthesis